MNRHAELVSASHIIGALKQVQGDIRVMKKRKSYLPEAIGFSSTNKITGFVIL